MDESREYTCGICRAQFGPVRIGEHINTDHADFVGEPLAPNDFRER